ncbi:MAG: ABC transporter permease [Acidisphaera sp.]|nr:ABC transporter permease [Acidisphaera sp.]
MIALAGGRPRAGRALRMPGDALARAGLALVVVSVGMAVLAPLLAPFGPDAIDYRAMLQGPSPAHLLGTDDLGRDVFTRLLYGGRLSLGVGVASVVLAVVAGVPIGLLSGYLGGIADEILMRVIDSVMAMPPLVLALTITAVLGPGLANAMLAIAIVAVPAFTRLVRGQVLSVKHEDYVMAAQSVGARPSRLVLRHILPNAINPVIVQAALGVGFAMITESSVSFIGLGAQPPTATWGSMVQVGFQYLETAPWLALAPAVMIFLAVLGFTMLGEGLRGLLDPAVRARG